MPDKRIQYLLGAAVLFAVMVISYIRDRRRFKRGQPFKVWGIGNIYPDDPMYDRAIVTAMTPYYVVFAIVGLLACLFAYFTFQYF